MRKTKYRGQCFEIYGFDIIIDATLRPWLLEVNVCPSLSSSSPFDKFVKSMLLSDTFHLVGFNIFDRKYIIEQKKIEKKKKLIGLGSQNNHTLWSAYNSTTNKINNNQNGSNTDNSTVSTGVSVGSAYYRAKSLSKQILSPQKNKNMIDPS